MLRQFFLFEIIIVKYRKVVNAAERRTRDHDKWGMLPVYPYLFRAGGAAAGPHGGVLCPDRACALVYCAASTPQGVLAQLRREQGGRVRSSTVLAPADSFGRIMRLLRYLCENGVGPEQWLEVLEDVHQPYQLLDTSKNAMNMAEEQVFCGICRF